MSVLLEGMEMPPPGTFNIIYIYSDGQVHMPSWGKGMTPINGVKAIPIPPHGRLIDADALGSFPYNMDFCDGGEADEWIQNAPTVIPASEELET